MIDAEWTRIESVASAVFQSPNRRLLGSVFLAMMEAEPPAATTARRR